MRSLFRQIMQLVGILSILMVIIISRMLAHCHRRGQRNESTAVTTLGFELRPTDY